jgi:hypothetical protein
MKKVMSARLAGNMLLFGLGAIGLFHILELFNGVLPKIIWGRQIGDSTINLLTLEIYALILAIAFAIIVAAKMDYLKAGKFKKAAGAGMWIIFIYLLLITVGNFASGVSFENLVFAPITVTLGLCAFRLAIEN